MGRLAVFHRRIMLAPDDVYIPAFYALVLHSVWLASSAVVFAVIHTDCNLSPVLTNFLLILIATLSLQVPIDIAMVALSMSGTVARKGPRRYVSGTVQLSFCILVWELAVVCYGIFVTYGPGNYLGAVNDPFCMRPVDWSSAALIHMVVLWSFIAIIFYFIGLGIFLANSDSKSGTKFDSYMKIWQQRLNYFVGTGGLVDSDVLRDVAGELANYFKDFDWAPSDVAVGLLLLKREQKKITEIRQARRLIIEQPEGFMIPTLESQQIREELAKVQGEEDATSKRMTWINGGKRFGVIGASDGKEKKKLFTLMKGLSLGPGLKVPGMGAGMEKGEGGRSSMELQVLGGAGMSASPAVTPELKPSLLEGVDDSLDTTMKTANDSGKSLTSAASDSKKSVIEDGFAIAITDSDHEGVHPERGMSPTKGGVHFASTVEVSNPAGSPASRIPIRDADHVIPINDGTDVEESAEDEAAAAKRGGARLKGKFSMTAIKSPSLGVFKTGGIQRSMSLTRDRSRGSPGVPQFRPFEFRKQKGTHRKKQTVQGTVHREEIDDILHFARFAEVVYTPEEVDLFYSDKLHFLATDNGIFRSPFLVVHDVDTDSIVIAVRGTYSASDVLVDLKFDVVPLEIPDFEGEEDHLAHSGFWHTAKNIVNDIMQLNILGPLLHEPSSEFYGCSLVVTGHSLGAGVASLLANFLRKDFPSTCCYAYEPPGCVVSARAAEYFESFCTSVVMGDDVVTRLSRNTLEMLKLDIDRHVKSCDEPKWRVVGSVLGSRICCASSNKTSTSRSGSARPGLLHRRTPSGHLVPADLETLKRRTTSLRVGQDNPFYEVPLPQIPMYLPGKILHIEKLRRPPLNLNQLLERQLKKVTGATKAVGKNLKAGAEGIVDLVFEGAEIVRDGVVEIVEFAEDVKDTIMDGADAVKDKIVKPKRDDGTSGARDELEGADGGIRIPLKDADSAEEPEKRIFKRRTSLGDILMSRTKSSGDPRLKEKAAMEVRGVASGGEEGQVDATGYGADEEMPRAKIKVGFEDAKSSEDVDRKARSRRKRRQLQRAQSAGKLGRSKSAGRDGYDTNAEETDADLGSSDEDLPGDAPRRPRGARRRSSRRPKQEGALTDTEVFSDTELAAFGGRRAKGSGSLKNLSGDELGPEPNVTNGFNGPKITTNFGKKAAAPPSPGSPTRAYTNPDLILASIKPRAHKDAVPSEPITGMGRMAHSASAMLNKPGSLPGSPVKDNFPLVPTSENPNFVSAPCSPEDLPLMPPALNTATITELKVVTEEPDEEVLQVRPQGVTFANAAPSVLSRDELVLSKPQYPPVPTAAKGKAAKPEGPNTHGKYHYVPRWARKEEFQEIIVSRSMIADHSPWDLLREFQAAPAGSVLGVVTRD